MRNRILKNASWIIGSRILQAVFSLFISMLTARYLGPANYGLINYASSLVAFVTPIMQMGINSVLVHEIIKHPHEEEVYVGTATWLNLLSSLLCIIGIVSFT
uniref:oligosaccharide flippase family protein n=1 Tax=Holdemanella sp. TaxID=1971762 RepID=UPI00307AF110